MRTSHGETSLSASSHLPPIVNSKLVTPVSFVAEASGPYRTQCGIIKLVDHDLTKTDGQAAPSPHGDRRRCPRLTCALPVPSTFPRSTHALPRQRRITGYVVFAD
jgi:hypothetical protein